MKVLKVFLLMIMFIGIPWLENTASACCSNANGTVTGISNLPGGQFFFSVSGSETGKPGCNTTNRFAVNLSTDGGKSIMAVVLSAYLSGKTVTVVGLQTCTIWGDSEDLGSLTSP